MHLDGDVPPSTKCSTWRCCGLGLSLNDRPVLLPSTKCSTWRCCGSARTSRPQAWSTSLNEVQHLAVLRVRTRRAGGRFPGMPPQRSAAPGGAAGQHVNVSPRFIRCCPQRSAAPGGAAGQGPAGRHHGRPRPSTKCSTWRCCGRAPDHPGSLRPWPSTKCSTWRCCGPGHRPGDRVGPRPSTKCSTWRCCGFLAAVGASRLGDNPQRSAAPGGAAGLRAVHRSAHTAYPQRSAAPGGAAGERAYIAGLPEMTPQRSAAPGGAAGRHPR